LLRLLVERIETARRVVVLDLGAAHARTLDLFGQFRCRIDIVDINDGLESLRGRSDRADLAAAVESLLPKARGELLDVVLCWDLLNYLERPALAALMAALARRARPGALAHGLIVYRESRMPARPGDYVLLDDYRLRNLTPSSSDRAAPRYTPEDLKGCMPDFAIERGRLLGNGMQEFLFRRTVSLEDQPPAGPRGRTRVSGPVPRPQVLRP
jgi:hypothetical protein